MEAAQPSAEAIFSTLRIESERAHAGTGGVLWGGTRCGLSLLDYLRAQGLGGARVLSLGCGLGALELVCACLGAHVTATDLEMVRPLFERNAQGNAAALAGRKGVGAVAFEPLDWRAPPPAAVLAAGPFAYALASDCVFWPELFEPLIGTMAALSAAQAPRPLHFFLLIEPRSPRELDFFVALRAAGFTYAKLDERHSQHLAGAVSSACAIFWCCHTARQAATAP